MRVNVLELGLYGFEAVPWACGVATAGLGDPLAVPLEPRVDHSSGRPVTLTLAWNRTWVRISGLPFSTCIILGDFILKLQFLCL